MKTAIVTGSKRGIGFEVAKSLLKDGYTVMFSDIAKEEEVTEWLAEINAEFDGRADYTRCDISVHEDRLNIVKKVSEKYGRLDVLVNNAGVSLLQRLDILETSVESFERLLRINLEGTFFMCQTAANAMLKQKETIDFVPRIVNIGSISAYTSSTARGEYCISKAGIAMTTQLFADRLADEGIPVFEVRPGIVKTDMTATVTEKYEKMIAEGVTPIKRFGMPKDIADGVMAACSGLMDFGTGTIINADGGFHIRRL